MSDPKPQRKRKITHQSFAGVAIADGQPRVRDEVGQAISAAQQALLCICGKALLCPLNAGVQSQGGGRVSLVLQHKGVW